MPPKRPRTAGVDLQDEVAQTILSAHVALSRCRPKELFRVKRSKDGLTSSWAEIQKEYTLLSKLLETTGGRKPNFRSFSKQLDVFLKRNSMTWALTDVEESVVCLRAMIATLVSMRRDETKKNEKV